MRVASSGRPARRSLAPRIALLGAIWCVLIGLGGVLVAYPAAAAAACPACFAFERLDGAAFVDRNATREQRAAAENALVDGRARVAAFYGPAAREPRILICSTQACYERLGGGGSRGMAMLDAALVLSPRGTDGTIAAHELAHAALHARIGRLATWRRTVPQWFDEGLAVVVSNDPRYLAPPGIADRCLVEPDGAMPADRRSWIETAESRDLYAKAACRVSRWIAQVGGAPAARQAIERWAAGAPFDVASR